MPGLMPRCAAAITALLGVVVLDAGIVAAAQSDAQGPGAGIVGGSPEAVVVVGASGTVASWGSSGTGGRRTWTCRYHEWSDGAPIPVTDDAPADPRAGRLYLFSCTDGGGQVVAARLVVFDPADPLAGVAAVERALEEARRRLALPAPRPAVNPPGAQLVGVPTWLWLEGPWAPASATAAIGAVTSTVTAQPVRAVWEMGDGALVECGPGVAFDPDLDLWAQSSDCTHVFTSASRRAPGGAYAVRVTLTHVVRWTASTGAGGPLGTLRVEATFGLVVRQAQAVIR